MSLSNLAEKTSRGHHKKILIIDGRRIPIDIGLAPIIDVLNNRLGIITTSCCQAGCTSRCKRKHKIISKNPLKRHVPKRCRESCYIAFYSAKDAEKFLKIVYRDNDPEYLREHMFGHGNKQSNAWHWSCYLTDINDWSGSTVNGSWIERHVGPTKLQFIHVVQFPWVHLKLITNRVLAKINNSGHIKT